MAKKCPNCGSTMTDRDVFCGHCGASVPGAAPTQVAPPPAAPPTSPAEEPSDGKSKLVLAGGATLVIVGVLGVALCLCLVVVAIAVGMLVSPEPTPTPRPTRTPRSSPTYTPRPSPTRTPRPSPTRTPRSSPTSESITTAYTDNFGKDEGNWSLTTSTNGKRWIEDGELHIEVRKANYVVWSRLKDYRYSDLTVEVDARVVSGTGGNYGLLFRMEDNSNFYRFVVSTSGNYKVVKLVGKQWKTIKGWTKSSAIKTGKSKNHLKVVAQGSTISVYANETKLTTVTDDAHTRGQVALIAAAGSTVDFEVAFDNFQVKP